jgi:hypothetical protein
VIPESHYVVAVGGKMGGASGIVLRTVAVLPAVDLHDEPCARTEEVDDVWPERDLSAEAKAFELSAAQKLPQLALGVGGLVAELSREQAV